MRSLALAFVLLALGAASGLEAQSMAVGTRVRIRGSDLVVPVIGNVQSLSNDTLLVLESGQGAQLWRFATGDVHSLEQSLGIGHNDPEHMRNWGLIGAGVGAAASLLVDVALNRNADPGFKYNYFKGGLLGLAGGGIVGVAYGSRKPVERWRDVPVPKRISIAPTRSGATLGLGFTF